MCTDEKEAYTHTKGGVQVAKSSRGFFYVVQFLVCASSVFGLRVFVCRSPPHVGVLSRIRLTRHMRRRNRWIHARLSVNWRRSAVGRLSRREGFFSTGGPSAIRGADYLLSDAHSPAMHEHLFPSRPLPAACLRLFATLRRWRGRVLLVGPQVIRLCAVFSDAINSGLDAT